MITLLDEDWKNTSLLRRQQQTRLTFFSKLTFM